MSKKPDYYSDKVNRFIGVAPCAISFPQMAPYPTIAVMIRDYLEEGKVFLSADGSMGEISAPKIDCSKQKTKNCEYEPGYPVSSIAYWS